MKNHRPENDKTCSSCGKEFKRKDHFQKHVNSCSNEPAFVPSFAFSGEPAADEPVPEPASPATGIQSEDVSVRDFDCASPNSSPPTIHHNIDFHRVSDAHQIDTDMNNTVIYDVSLLETLYDSIVDDPRTEHSLASNTSGGDLYNSMLESTDT